MIVTSKVWQIMNSNTLNQVTTELSDVRSKLLTIVVAIYTSIIHIFTLPVCCIVAICITIEGHCFGSVTVNSISCAIIRRVPRKGGSITRCISKISTQNNGFSIIPFIWTNGISCPIFFINNSSITFEVYRALVIYNVIF